MLTLQGANLGGERIVSNAAYTWFAAHQAPAPREPRLALPLTRDRAHAIGFRATGRGNSDEPSVHWCSGCLAMGFPKAL